MRKKIISLAAGVFAAVAPVWAASLDLNPPDLSPLAVVREAKGDPIPLIVNGKPMLPIVVAPDKKYRSWNRIAAKLLADSIQEMCGTAPELIFIDPKKKQTLPEGPAIWIGYLEQTKAAGFSADGMVPGEFAVKTKDGSIYLYGNDESHPQAFGSSYAATDFAERVLGVRQYFEPEKGGRSVLPAKDLTVPPLDYGDRPVFAKRDLWPYETKPGYVTWRIADTHGIQLRVHTPYWKKDYGETHPEIFQMENDGTRTRTQMLCYSNPMTLKLYLERIEEELKGGRKAGFLSGSAVSVSPDDMGVNCFCPDCRKLYDEEAGPFASASKIMCAFVRKLSDALAETHPELTVIYLPYANYCDPAEGVEFPAKNVEIQLCTMPGLALLKDPSVKKHEEDLILAWEKISGRKVQNWHYICWPAEFTSAPYIFADTAIRHYKDMRGLIVGSFLNGGYPEARLLLSAYVWCKALWNPELNEKAIFDVFAERMFGPAAKPMRRIIELQAEGWKRPWEVAKPSPKNIFEISYPRKEVEEMEACFAEAEKIAAGDEQILKRIAYYKSGFPQFFKESKEHAEGTAFAPLMMKKVASNPIIDGKLDDPEWKLAEGLPFIRATDRKRKEAVYPTEIKAVWTPQGVTFGFRMTEPVPDKLFVTDPPGSWFNDNVELFLDVTGKGAGDYYQVILDARNEGLLLIHATEKGWKGEGIRSNVARGKDCWTAEIYIPFQAFRNLKDAQIPSTSADGKFWIGNFTRHRVADAYQKEGKTPGSVSEMQRLNTCYQYPSADQSAFGVIQFVE